jgi:hypothetical protein
MTFGLKNDRATYQIAMNLIFHDLLGMILQIYIDDLVIRSAGFKEHLADLRVYLERMKKYNLKLNTLMCAFGVSIKRFLGFFIRERGIEVDPKVELIRKLGESTCKRDVPKLLGKVNYLWWFIANLVRKVDLFLPLVQLKHHNQFGWRKREKEAFKKIKEYLMSPPILRVPKTGEDFRLYEAA